MEGGEITHHALILVLLVGMNGLGMLTKVVKTRKLLATVTAKRAFTRVFPGGDNDIIIFENKNLRGGCWTHLM